MLCFFVACAMYLYNLTLQRATGILIACHGNFSGSKQQEVAVAKGKVSKRTLILNTLCFEIFIGLSCS